MRIPVQTSMKIDEFVGGAIVVADSLVKNMVFDKNPKGDWTLTQRPAVNVSGDPTGDGISAVRGRGVYDWAAVDAKYFVNDDEVYKGDYGTTVRESALSVTNLTQAAGTATVTVNNTYAAGDYVYVSGANQAGYNGRVKVLTASATDFTYSVDSGTVSPATGTITSRRTLGPGTGKVYIHECGDYLVLLDIDNNQGWTISSAASTTLAKIEHADFPPNQSPAYTLCRGGFVLNNRLYVGTTDATLHGSALGNPTSWDALNVLTAEFDPDGGVMCFKHNEFGVFGGPRTLEFFYDAGNPTGSPLSPNPDVQTIGIATEDTHWENNGVTYFVGLSLTGELGVYQLTGMIPQKVSTTDIDSFLTTSVVTEGCKLIGSGVAIGGRVFYVLTTYNIVSTNPSAVTSLVYEAISQTWTVWDLMQVDDFPIVDWTRATRTEIGTGILLDGKLVTMADDFVPNDRTNSTGWVTSGWVTAGWVSDASTDGTPIEIEVITGQTDLDTQNRKFVSSYRIAGKRTTGSQTLSLAWSNESNDDYGTPRSIDLSVPGQRAARCGSFRNRNHKITGSPTEKIYISGIETEVTAGST